MSNEEKTTVEEIVKDWQKTQNDQTFEELLDQFKGSIKAHASRFKFYSLDSDDIELILQKVLFWSAKTFDPDRKIKFKTFFWTSVHNEMISLQDASKAHKREGEKDQLSLDTPVSNESDVTLASLVPSKQRNHADEVCFRCDVEKALKAIHKDFDREVLRLLLDDPDTTKAELVRKIGKSDVAVSDAIKRLKDNAKLRAILLCN